MSASLINPSESLNWNRFGTWNLNSPLNQKGDLLPIPPVSATAPSPVILVGASSENIPFRWRWGGSVECLIEADPGSRSDFTGLARIGKRAIPLGNLGLYQFPRYQAINLYYYTFFPGKYFSQLYLEAWWYDGPIETDVQAGIAELLNRTN